MTVRTVADIETGEIFVIPILTEQQRRYAERARQIEVYKKKGPNFIACYSHEIRKINHELTLIEAGAMMRLLGYMRWNQGGKLIVKDKPLRMKDLAKVFGKGETQTKAILKRLEAVELVIKVREGKSNVFFINPRFFQFGGNLGTGYFTKLYQVKARNLVKELTLQEAGMLWKVISYFHYGTYYLCANPDEPNPKEIKHMDRETLAAHIGHDVSTVSHLMNALRQKGALLTTESRGSKRYLINPDLMYRKNYEDAYTQSIRELFKQHEVLRKGTAREAEE
jgi:hypothetical protein